MATRRTFSGSYRSRFFKLRPGVHPICHAASDRTTRGRRHWIIDNDGKYSDRTAAVLGKRLIWTSIEAPDMNSFIERWNLSAQSECLDHVVMLSETMLRHYVESYIQHYNSDRPHQGIGNVPIGPWAVGAGEIVCDESLDGLLKSFRRAA